MAEVYEQIGAACAWALRMEVCATPKPGLVDRMSSGAHTDMDLSTFLTSIRAIAPYFGRCAREGEALSRVDGSTLARIRPLGVACEETMLAATGGVNTHKGAIFSLGILACAAGYCRRALGDLSPGAVCRAAGTIAAAALEDFRRPERAATKGRRLYDSWGIRGIRGEAASGFASVRRWALPALQEGPGEAQDPDSLRLQALLTLMANVEDTNVLARGGREGLAYLQAAARQALALGGALTPRGKEFLVWLDGECIRRNLSPGGCADLLSAAILLRRLPELDAERSRP